MSWFNHWSFSRKLMVVNAGYVLPCAVLTCFLVLDDNNKIAFNRKETMGVEYQVSLESLLTHVSQHKLLALDAAKEDVEAKSKLDASRTQIERDFAGLDEVDARLQETLEMTPMKLAPRKRESAAAQALKSSWQALQASAQSPKEALEKFDKLIADIRLAITHVGDTSNLILDPDLDSYYMMDTVLLGLPQVQARLQELLGFLRGIDDPAHLSDATRIEIAVYARLLKSDIERVASSVQTALTEDRTAYGISPSLQREIPLAVKDFTNAVAPLMQFINEASQGTQTKEGFKTLYATGDKAMDANQLFWQKSASELTTLVNTRISAIEHARALALILALLAWLPPLSLAIWTVSRLNGAFSRSVAKLESEAQAASASSMHLASASQTVSSGSTEQAAAIQETGASMSEMASMVSRSSTQSMSSQQLARKVKERTDEGCQVMARMVDSMESIQEANAQLQNISNIINDISGKTNIINDIVGKTQLLSFNASIEAARAGQHGRGFAVVAEEVGNLAQTSGNAAKEIRNLIEDSRQQVEHILKSTLERVSESRSVTEQAQTIFTAIAQEISDISTQVESISEAAREQQFGIEQIAKAMTQMDQSTQLNNSAALTAARLSDQLKNQSRKLTTIAKTVSDLVLGKKAPKAVEANDGDDELGPYLERPKPTLVHVKKKREQTKTEDLPEKVAQAMLNNDQELARLSSDGLAPSALNADDDSFQKAG